MAVSSTSIDWNNLNTFTEKVQLPRLVDQIFNSNPALNSFWKKGTKLGGGTYITQPVIYGEGPAESFEGMTPADVSEAEQFTNAVYEWKHYRASSTIRRSDELKNSGPEAIMKLSTAKLKIMQRSLRNVMAQGLYSDGADPLNITGLRAAVTTGAVTYGNISKSAYTWWASTVDTSTTTWSNSAGRTMMGNVTEDGETPDIILTTQLIYNAVYNQMEPQKRYTSSRMANAGFMSILFEGRPVVVDSHCPTSHMYFLNSEYLDLISHRDENMRFEPYVKPFGQAGRSAFLYWFGNLATASCRFQGVFTGLTG